jgi:hypothetical protein
MFFLKSLNSSLHPSSVLIGSLQHGACTIQPTQVSFSSDELADMVRRCSLNRLNQFATFVAIHLRNSRSDTKLLDLLKSLDEVLYSGLTLGKEEEGWAYKNGIQLKASLTLDDYMLRSKASNYDL